MKFKTLMALALGAGVWTIGGLGAFLYFHEPQQTASSEEHQDYFSVEKPHQGAIAQSIREGVMPACRRYLAAVMLAKYKSPAEAEAKGREVEEALSQVHQRLNARMGLLLENDARPLTAEDLPEAMPAVYRARIQGVLESGSQAEPGDTVWAVVQEWKNALDSAAANVAEQLVPEHPYALAGGFDPSPASDAWLEMTREQQLVRLHVAGLLSEYGEEWDSVLYEAGYQYYSREDVGERTRFLKHTSDYRHLIAPLLVNLAQQEAFDILMLEAYPGAALEYSLPEDARPRQLSCLVERMQQKDSFVSLNHSLLLKDYSFDEDDEYATAAEIRQETERKLERLMQNMEKAYLAQQRYLCAAYATYMVEDGFSDDDFLTYFETELAKIQQIFSDDIKILRKYACWLPSEAEPEQDTIPPAPMKPVAIPSFMIQGTPGEGERIYLYRRSGDAVRADVRRAYKDAFNKGYELLIGGCYSRDCPAAALHYKYMQRCLDDAEYAWARYVSCMGTLMLPLRRIEWGTGTGVVVSEQMSQVYENHSRFYTDVLRIYPADFSQNDEGE